MRHLKAANEAKIDSDVIGFIGDIGSKNLYLIQTVGVTWRRQRTILSAKAITNPSTYSSVRPNDLPCNLRIDLWIKTLEIMICDM